MKGRTSHRSSFRDPSGSVFEQDGVLYRQVNPSYREHYDHLIGSGLYEELVSSGLMVSHEEVDPEALDRSEAYRVLRPSRIPFVSYPYEWSFSQLKDAALTTLRIQKEALDHGMTLKDCSAYNVQFLRSRPVFIDTLSFERYREGDLWVAYRQFCQHFLAPLALMARVDVRLGRLLRLHIDGVPLDLASRLLPFSTRINPPLLSHLHLHARNGGRYADRPVDTSRYRLSRMRFLGLLDSIEGAVRGLRWRPAGTEWGEYYSDTNYGSDGLENKARVVAELLDSITPAPASVWDLGGNTGRFSRIASGKGIPTISFDMDHACIERSYLQVRRESDLNLLPLVLDLTNPSPGLGWAGNERDSLEDRGPADAVMALALIHHLAISNNVPLDRIAEYFGRLCRWLVIEFVPKEDSQVGRLLSTRPDVFPGYSQQGFEEAFSGFFVVRRSLPVRDSCRTVYLMSRE